MLDLEIVNPVQPYKICSGPKRVSWYIAGCIFVNYGPV